MKTAEQIAAEKAAQEEQMKAKAMIAEAVAGANAPLIEATKSLISAVEGMVSKGVGAVATGAQKSTSNMDGVLDHDEPRPDVRVGKEVIEGTGLRAIRVVKAKLAAQLANGANNVTEERVRHVLEEQGYKREAEMLKRSFDRAAHDAKHGNKVERALAQSTFADGGALVPAEYSAELIALLRNTVAVRKMGATTFPMGPTFEMPSQTGAGTAYYVGEQTAITPSQQTLGGLKMTEKKLAALTVISNDLIRNAVISAEEFVRNDLLQVLSLKEDYQMLFGAGSAYSPRGITSLTLAANQVNSAASSQAAPTLAELKTELGKCVQVIMEGNIPMAKLGWIMSPRTWRYIWMITDGNGNSVFQSEMAQGKLLGHPFVVTNQIPNNLTWSLDGSADVSSIFFGDFAQFLIGEAMGLEISAFPNAAYDDSGTVKSGLSQDQSVIRALLKHDFNVRYTNSFRIVKTRMGV